MVNAAPPAPPASLKRRLGLAAGAVLWERLWPALWPSFAVIAAFVILALFDLPSRLPSALHWTLLAILVALLAAALFDAARRFHLPGLEAARRRIETASGLRHRPLTALQDKLAGGSSDPATVALWQAHQARM